MHLRDRAGVADSVKEDIDKGIAMSISATVSCILREARVERGNTRERGDKRELLSDRRQFARADERSRLVAPSGDARFRTICMDISAGWPVPS